jgi:hypothetical protein
LKRVKTSTHKVQQQWLSWRIQQEV